jgi:hypothetical protein
MARILVLSFSDHARDSRVHSQLQALRDDYELLAAGFGAPDAEVEFVDLRPPASKLGARRSQVAGLARMLSRRFDAAYWGNRVVRHALAQLDGTRCDAVLSNDIDTLPLALRVADGKPVVFDAHEYYPEQFYGWWWRLSLGAHLSHLCRRYMRQASAVMTVSPGIAQRYRDELGVETTVVMNLPDPVELTPSPVGKPIRLIHHGGADRRRRLHLMIEAMALLPGDFTLDFALVGDTREVDRLRAAAVGDERISFVSPVPMTQLPTFLNDYDAGVYLLRPGSFNHLHALPNKLFQFVQARLAVAIAPSPDMAEVVRRHQLGVVADDFTPEAFARALGSLDAERVMSLKANADQAASELNADVARGQVLRLVNGALG